jgi:endogenous inhibitor of DNA gyrase (YacG/DUF329 family)
MWCPMSNVRVCPKCRKPFVQRDPSTPPYCSTECYQATLNPGKWASDKAASFQEYRRRKAEESAPQLTETEHGVVRWVWPGKRPRQRQFKPRKMSDFERAKERARTRLKWSKEREKIVDVLAQIKLDSGCVDCGYKGHPTVLQFDHVRGEKIMAVSQFQNLAKALAEAEKCEIRCANCHHIKTFNWKQKLRQDQIAKDLTLLAKEDTSRIRPRGVVSLVTSGIGD